MPSSIKTHGFLHETKKLDSSYRLFTPALSEAGEAYVLSYINGYVHWLGKPISLKVGAHVFDNVYGANKVNGTPKADIAIVTYNAQLKRFENSCYISHKMGNSAASFFRYGGVSTKPDGTKFGTISKHKEVVSFLKDLSFMHKHIVNARQRVFRPLKDKALIAKAIYGPEHNSAAFTENNVNVICQGNPAIRKYGTDAYTLTFTGGMAHNPDILKFSRGDYAAVLEARYESTSSFEVNNKRFSSVRVSISPRAVVSKSAEEI